MNPITSNYPPPSPNPIPRTKRFGLALAAAVFLALPAQAATITYNFNDGTIQGWHNRVWSLSANAWVDLAPGVTTMPYSVNNGVIQPPSNDNNLFGNNGSQIDPVGGSTDYHQNTLWLRSPAFALDGSGDLTVQMARGRAHGSAPANEAAVSYIAADGSANTGWKGVILRNLASGAFVLAKPRTAEGDAMGTVIFTQAELAPYLGQICTLELINSERGGWGWLSMDNVSIPGALRSLTVAGSPSVTVGGSSSLIISLPPGHNASAAVTVYVTNSTPGIVTLNGSSASPLAVTFAAGGASTQTVTVSGVALGFAPLAIACPGLETIPSGVTVLPASGLIGRWISGAEDLLDKSGYTPAGTHDGTLSGGFIPSFNSADVPPGATGSSLDFVTSGGGAVVISNTVFNDPAYRPTFDAAIARQFSVAFWAKGLPGEWNPFVSKNGEGQGGWQVRRFTTSPVATFTIRGTRGEDDPGNGSTFIDDGAWHHFAATWDGVSGLRKFYVDGKLNNVVPHDFAPLGPAEGSYLCLGGRVAPGSVDPGNLLYGQLYDVQLYGLPLDGAAVQGIYTRNTAQVIAHADSSVIDLGKTSTVSVAIPAGANASAAVTVYVTNTTPAIVGVSGAVGNVATLTFPAGGANSQTLTLTGLAEGSAQLVCAATSLTGANLSLKVYGKHLIGRWFNGAENRTDNSGFAPGTHDGTEFGNVGNLSFTNDVPPAKTGKGAYFPGDVAVVINNSAVTDGPTYAPTFDDVMANQFSVSFWAKGIPGTWNAFVSKRGESQSGGWQMRRGGGTTEAFTLRGSGNPNYDGVGSVNITDGQWHHYAAIWDGYTGTRKCYIDGNLDPNINLTGDFAGMLMAPNHPLVLGGRATAGVQVTPQIEGNYSGTLYDVQMHNYALSETEVKALAFVPALRVVPALRSLEAAQSMTVDIVIPEGANQSQAVTVQVTDTTPTIASLNGAVGNVLTLNYPVGGSVTQQVTVVGIADGTASLTASGGGYVAGTGRFNVWADPGSKLIGRWLSGPANLNETSGFRPAGRHDGVAVGNTANLMFSAELPPPYATSGGNSLDLTLGGVAVAVTNSSTVDPNYAETFDHQMAKKFSVAFWAKGTPMDGGWNPWISKRGENDWGYQVRRFGDDNPARPTFTIRGTTGGDDPWIGTQVADDEWHHYAGTWDSATGIRKLYLDGEPILNMTGDTGTMGLALADHLVFGGRDNGGFGNFFTGLLYDIRVYSYAIDPLLIRTLFSPPDTFALELNPTTIPLGETMPLIVTVPVTATATTPLTVYLTNNSPAVVTIVGSTGNVFPLIFPVGTSILSVNLLSIGPGQINITAGAAGQTSTQLTSVNTVVERKLVGHWLNGATDLTDKSGFTPAGTHDLVNVGLDPIVFSTDVPAGFTGQSLDLIANGLGGTVGVMVNNSADVDAAYVNTFNEGISWSFSVAVWAKGTPSGWNGFVTKRGENGIGWQMRRSGGDAEAFTIRGTASGNEDGVGSVNITDASQWRHYVGVWNGIAGTRQVYVNGVLDPSVDLTGDFGPMNLAPSHHLAIGARETGGIGGFEGWFNGKIYDVRIYNYPISAADAATLAGLAPAKPELTIVPWTGSQVRISWPTSWTGFNLEQSTSVNTGWGPSGLSVVVEGSENAAYAPAVGNQFYRLIK